MVALYTNNASTLLASSITALDTTITVATGQGSQFPSPTGSDYFMATIQSITNSNREIVKCTSRTGDVLTVVRAQEGTTAYAFNANDVIELRVTAGEMNTVTTMIPPGTVMLFYQASAPVSWTQVTTLNDYDLRLVSGTGGTTGGTTAYSTVFTDQTPSISVSVSGSVGATTLSEAQMPSHTHTFTSYSGNMGSFAGASGASITGSTTTNSTGGNGSHSHSFSGSGSATSSAITLNVRYANIIICSKD